MDFRLFVCARMDDRQGPCAWLALERCEGSMRRNPYLHSLPQKKAEGGYILLGVLLLAALLLISLAVAAPRVAMDLRRDKELEAIRRANQYVRAIRLFHQTVGRYPVNLEELEQTGNRRFLRKRYIDPITNKADWRLLHFGQVHRFQTLIQPSDGGSAPASGSNASNTTPDQALSSPIGLYAAGPDDPAASPSDNAVLEGPSAIVGIGLPMHHSSIIAYHQQLFYDQWEFIYDPHFDWTRRVH